MAFWCAAEPPSRRPRLGVACTSGQSLVRSDSPRSSRRWTTSSADFCPKLVMARRSSIVRSTSSPIVLICAALQAVAGPLGQVELLDAQVEVGRAAGGRARVAELEALRGLLEVGHERHQVAQRVAGRGQGLAGVDGAVGLDVEHQAVVVGRLLHPHRLDVEGDTVHRREDRVDRDDPDGRGLLVLVRRGITAAALHRDVDGQAALGVDGGDVQVGVEDLDVGRQLQVRCRGVSRATDVEAQGHRLVGVHPDEQVLEVQDDVGDVLLDPGQRRELVQRLVEAELGHGTAGDGREQRAPERVAERGAEARVERADGEALAVVLLLVDDFDGRPLDDQHGGYSCCGWGRAIGYCYFEYSSTMSCS